MNLYQQILLHALAEEEAALSAPELRAAMDRAVEMRCYGALVKIKRIIEDESLEDPECFQKIEAIIRALEELGSGGGFRHDFG